MIWVSASAKTALVATGFMGVACGSFVATPLLALALGEPRLPSSVAEFGEPFMEGITTVSASVSMSGRAAGSVPKTDRFLAAVLPAAAALLPFAGALVPLAAAGLPLADAGVSPGPGRGAVTSLGESIVDCGPGSAAGLSLLALGSLSFVAAGVAIAASEPLASACGLELMAGESAASAAPVLVLAAGLPVSGRTALN